MEVLTLGGKRYVKASKAAKDLGYARDYVGQLCRTGAVDAHLVGRTWYVNPDVLGAHRLEKKRNARVKAREYAKKFIDEAKTISVQETTKGFKNIAIRYNEDTNSLIPEVKKIQIASEKEVIKEESKNDQDSYTILNKDKKIVMSGSISVYDVDEETELTDTTILTPRVFHPRKVKDEHPKSKVQAEEVSGFPIDAQKPITFTEKLKREGSIVFSESEPNTSVTHALETPSQEPEDAVPQEEIVEGATRFQLISDSNEQAQSVSKPSYALLFSIFFVLTLVSFASLFLANTASYRGGKLEQYFTFDTSVIDYINNIKEISAKR